MAKYNPNKIPETFHCKKCKSRCFTIKNKKRFCEKCNDYA